jgi:hypothetical protein
MLASPQLQILPQAVYQTLEALSLLPTVEFAPHAQAQEWPLEEVLEKAA